MEERKANTIAFSSVLILIIVTIIARVTLKLSKTFFLICGADGAAILAVIAYAIIGRRNNRRRMLLETQLVSQGRELRMDYSFLRKVAGVPTKFRLKEIQEATDGFRSLLGKGASASVFKGILNDGTAVAVKRIVGDERGEKEFKSEVAAIASVQHVNLVRLLGYCCVPSGPRYLVYEFVPNGSLDLWIFPSSQSERASRHRGGCLSWNLRQRVAIDVAKGLSYLHHDCRSRILHLDVKPENILLDQNYRAFVADFGLSKLMGKEESRIVTTIRGTEGYLAPEWLLEFGVSEKSDIYSYGMVLLEIVGGRRNVTAIQDGSKKRFQYFPKIVVDKLREGKLMEVVDHRLIEAGGVDERQVKNLVCVALWCIQEKPKLRPSMAQVVEMLEGHLPVEEPPPQSPMIVVDLLGLDQESSSSASVNFHDRLRSSPRSGTQQLDGRLCSFTWSVLSGR